VAETLKDLRDSIDSIETKIDSIENKYESDYEELADKLAKITQDLAQVQSAGALAIGAAQAEINSLKSAISNASLGTMQTDIASMKTTLSNASLGTMQADIAEAKTTISNAKFIGATASIIIALLGGVGVWQIVKTQLEVKQERAHFINLSNKADELIAQHARMLKDSLIDKIELDLNSEASLDSLKGKPQVERIRANAKVLEGLNSKLPPSDQSSYFMIGNALSAFLSDNCTEVLRLLAQVGGSDQNYFGYAYMQGACYLRTNRPEEARQSFTRATKLTEGKRVQMTLNAQGVSNLAFWKATKGSKPAEAKEAIDAATAQFENLKTSYPEFTAAYVNLACAYSALHDFSKVSETLSQLRGLVPLEVILERIQDDMTRTSDEYMTSYVREELKITISPNDPRWKQQLASRLPPPPKP
jgi:tetratricopeptide (TPR) repeat protein